MWRQIKNFFFSVITYNDLSPNLKIRRLVNQALRHRAALSLDEWFECFWQHKCIAKSVVAFVYVYLEKYSGLQMARVRPSDRLERDLHFSLICWFDWQLNLCEDFLQCFGVDISERLPLYQFSTVEDFIAFLNKEFNSHLRETEEESAKQEFYLHDCHPYP